jgi:hypothetical protein
MKIHGVQYRIRGLLGMFFSFHWLLWLVLEGLMGMFEQASRIFTHAGRRKVAGLDDRSALLSPR